MKLSMIARVAVGVLAGGIPFCYGQTIFSAKYPVQPASISTVIHKEPRKNDLSIRPGRRDNQYPGREVDQSIPEWLIYRKIVLPD